MLSDPPDNMKAALTQIQMCQSCKSAKKLPRGRAASASWHRGQKLFLPEVWQLQPRLGSSGGGGGGGGEGGGGGGHTF